MKMIISNKVRLAILLAIFLAPAAVFSSTNTTPYAMTISGGISLGNYEAGMNWAIIETFRLARENKVKTKNSELLSITGASAGSINALVSALRYCQTINNQESTVNNNLFKNNPKLLDNISNYIIINQIINISKIANIKYKTFTLALWLNISVFLTPIVLLIPIIAKVGGRYGRSRSSSKQI